MGGKRFTDAPIELIDEGGFDELPLWLLLPFFGIVLFDVDVDVDDVDDVDDDCG